MDKDSTMQSFAKRLVLEMKENIQQTYAIPDDVSVDLKDSSEGMAIFSQITAKVKDSLIAKWDHLSESFDNKLKDLPEMADDLTKQSFAKRLCIQMKEAHTEQILKMLDELFAIRILEMKEILTELTFAYLDMCDVFTAKTLEDGPEMAERLLEATDKMKQFYLEKWDRLYESLYNSSKDLAETEKKYFLEVKDKFIQRFQEINDRISTSQDKKWRELYKGLKNGASLSMMIGNLNAKAILAECKSWLEETSDIPSKQEYYNQTKDDAISLFNKKGKSHNDEITAYFEAASKLDKEFQSDPTKYCNALEAWDELYECLDNFSEDSFTEDCDHTVSLQRG